MWAKDTFTGVRQSKFEGKRNIGGETKTGETPATDVGGTQYKIPAGRQDYSVPKSYGATTYKTIEVNGQKKTVIDTTAKTYSPKSFHFGGSVAISGTPTRGGRH